MFLPYITKRTVGPRLRSFPPRSPCTLFFSITSIAKIITLAVVLGLPLFLIPVANVVLLFVLFGYLNVRSLVKDSLDGLASRDEQRLIVRRARIRLIFIGTLLGGAPLISLLGLMTPAWIGAATCHLCLRELLASRKP